ncbi:MAG: VTT domain-containing protein [Dehalococcoidia bacterium]
MSRSTLVRLGAFILVIAAALLALNLFVDIDRSDLEDAIDRAGIWGPIAYAVILALGLSIPFNPVSDLLTVTVAALILDPFEAILATFAAHSFAVIVNYAVARRFGAGILDRVSDQPRLHFLHRLRESIDLKTVFVLRLALPLTAIGIDFVSYLAGMKRLNFAGYYLVSVVPWTLMSVVYFTSAGALRDSSPVLVFVPAVVLIAGSSLLVFLLRRRRVIDA